MWSWQAALRTWRNAGSWGPAESGTLGWGSELSGALAPPGAGRRELGGGWEMSSCHVVGPPLPLHPEGPGITGPVRGSARLANQTQVHRCSPADYIIRSPCPTQSIYFQRSPVNTLHDKGHSVTLWLGSSSPTPPLPHPKLRLAGSHHSTALWGVHGVPVHRLDWGDM